MFIDTHCHLHDREFFSASQAEEMLRRATENNVKQIICIGTNHEDSIQACNFAGSHQNVFWTYGIHPEYASSEKATVRENNNHTSHPIAIGEIGLDYHYDDYNRQSQIKLFEQMLQLARDNDLPVSLHIREAFEDAFAVLDNFPGIRGVVHSFTGSKKDLKQILARNLYVGVNGLITYTTPPVLPLERILLETDAPFLTPVPFRGTINEPSYIRNIAAYLAEKMGVAESKIREQTTQNANKLFRIKTESS